MTTFSIETFNTIINQRSKDDGHVSTAWTTKLLRDIENHTISLEQDENNNLLLNGVMLSHEVMLGLSLENIYDQTGYSLTDYLERHKNGVLSKLQLRYVGKDDKAVKPATGNTITSEEYKNNYIKSVSIDTLALYSEVSKLVNDPNFTKDKALAYLKSLEAKLFPTEKLETYLVMVSKEEEQAKQWEALIGLGFDNIQMTALGNLTGVLSLADANNLAQLSGLGYVLIDSSVDIATSSIKVTFKQGEQPKIA